MTDSLTKLVGRARERAQVAEALDRDITKRVNAERLVPADSPYQRYCFICGLRGDCKHREPLVEAAYAEVRARRRV